MARITPAATHLLCVFHRLLGPVTCTTGSRLDLLMFAIEPLYYSFCMAVTRRTAAGVRPCLLPTILGAPPDRARP